MKDVIVFTFCSVILLLQDSLALLDNQFSISNSLEIVENDLHSFGRSKTAKQFNRRRLHQLNDAFIPTHYDLQLRVILDKDGGSVPGRVRIFGVNQQIATRIVLHAGLLKMNESSVKVYSQGKLLQLKKSQHKPQVNLFVIELENEIGPGKELEIVLEYVAGLNFHFIGLRSKNYTEESTGVVKKMVFTNLQTLRAQDSGLDTTLHRASFCYSVFPCFDEPHLKATYELTIIRKTEQVALSNAQLLSSVPYSKFDGWVVDKFAKSIRMPPHFFMFVVGEFGYVEKLFGMELDKKLKVYAPKHHIHKAQFEYIADVSAKVLTFYENYFNSSANLTKMDLVFAPTFDLLESWGMSYHGYRVSKQGFMTKPGDNIIPKSNDSIDFSVLDTISPVLAKQWVGSWWSSEAMALSEALAEFTEFYLGLNHVAPKLSETRIMVELQTALMKDSDFFRGQEDYRRKGAPLLRMFEGILSKEGFRDGLRAYVQKTIKEIPITTEGFIQILQDSAGNRTQISADFSFTQVAQNFLNNTGYPLVKVVVENKTHFSLTEEKFLAKEQGVWYVPIKVQIGRGNVKHVWLQPGGAPIHVPGNTSELIVIDPEARGYYRIIYEDKLLHRLKAKLELDATTISSPLTRSRFILDYFTFADKNISRYETALNLATYLSPDAEPSYTVWLAFLWKFRSDVVRPFLAHPEFPVVHAYFSLKIDPLLYELDYEPPSPYVTFLRHWLLKYSCQYRTSYCVNIAQNIFSLWQSTPNSSLSSLSSHFTGIAANTMECVIISAEGTSAFSFMLEKYRNTKLPQSLACAKDPTLIQLLLDSLVDPLYKGFSPKLRKTMLTNLIDNHGRVEILPFLSNNFETVVELVGGGDLGIMLYSLFHLVEHFCTSEQLQELDAFVEFRRLELETYDFGNGKWVLNKLFGVVRKNIEWMDTNGSEILGWLDEAQERIILSNYHYFGNEFVEL